MLNFKRYFFTTYPIYHSPANILTTEKSNTFIPPKCDNRFRIIFYHFSHYFHFNLHSNFHSNFFINHREYITDSINQTNNPNQLPITIIKNLFVESILRRFYFLMVKASTYIPKQPRNGSYKKENISYTFKQPKLN